MTQFGRAAVGPYHAMEEKATAAIADDMKQFSKSCANPRRVTSKAGAAGALISHTAWCRRS